MQHRRLKPNLSQTSSLQNNFSNIYKKGQLFVAKKILYLEYKTTLLVNRLKYTCSVASENFAFIILLFNDSGAFFVLNQTNFRNLLQKNV